VDLRQSWGRGDGVRPSGAGDDVTSRQRGYSAAARGSFQRQYSERKCADTIGTVPVRRAGHFQR